MSNTMPGRLVSAVKLDDDAGDWNAMRLFVGAAGQCTMVLEKQVWDERAGQFDIFRIAEATMDCEGWLAVCESLIGALEGTP